MDSFNFALGWDENPFDWDGSDSSWKLGGEKERLSVFLGRASTGLGKEERAKIREVAESVDRGISRVASEPGATLWHCVHANEFDNDQRVFKPEDVYLVGHHLLIRSALAVFVINRPSAGVAIQDKLASDCAIPRIFVCPEEMAPREDGLVAWMHVEDSASSRILRYRRPCEVEGLIAKCLRDFQDQYHEVYRRRRMAIDSAVDANLNGTVLRARLSQHAGREKIARAIGIGEQWLELFELQGFRVLDLSYIQLHMILRSLGIGLEVWPRPGARHGRADSVSEQSWVYKVEFKLSDEVDVEAGRSLDRLFTFMRALPRPLNDENLLARVRQIQPEPAASGGAERRSEEPLRFSICGFRDLVHDDEVQSVVQGCIRELVAERGHECDRMDQTPEPRVHAHVGESRVSLEDDLAIIMVGERDAEICGWAAKLAVDSAAPYLILTQGDGRHLSTIVEGLPGYCLGVIRWATVEELKERLQEHLEPTAGEIREFIRYRRSLLDSVSQMEIGYMIFRHRVLGNVSMEQLAERTGLPTVMLRAVERGRMDGASLSFLQFLLIAMELRCRVLIEKAISDDPTSENGKYDEFAKRLYTLYLACEAVDDQNVLALCKDYKDRVLDVHVDVPVETADWGVDTHTCIERHGWVPPILVESDRAAASLSNLVSTCAAHGKQLEPDSIQQAWNKYRDQDRDFRDYTVLKTRSMESGQPDVWSVERWKEELRIG